MREKLPGFSGEKEEDSEGMSDVRLEITGLIGELQKVKEEDDESLYSEVLVPQPTDTVVLEKALKRLQTEGDKEVRRTEVGKVENPSEKIDNPSILVDDFNSVLMEFKEDLAERLSGREHKINKGFRHLADSETTEMDEPFAYILAETDKALIVGGGSDIIFNISSYLEFDEVEREFIRLVYDQMVRESTGLNDLEAHLILDDVLVIFDEDAL